MHLFGMGSQNIVMIVLKLMVVVSVVEYVLKVRDLSLRILFLFNWSNHWFYHVCTNLGFLICWIVGNEGKESGPFDLSVCTSTSSWVYDSCESQYEWLPVYSSILYLFVYGLFLTTVNAVVGEIFPLEYSSSAVGICWSLNWILVRNIM